MRRPAPLLLLLLLALLALLAFLLPAQPAAAGATSFRTYALIVDPGGERLAAWQVELTSDPAAVRIVGVEGGPAPWGEAPYYDLKGFDAGRMVIASFTLAPDPPADIIRVARIHVQQTLGNVNALHATLVTAADPAGRRIGATVRLIPEEGERP